jgi:hypothetical protein
VLPAYGRFYSEWLAIVSLGGGWHGRLDCTGKYRSFSSLPKLNVWIGVQCLVAVGNMQRYSAG